MFIIFGLYFTMLLLLYCLFKCSVFVDVLFSFDHLCGIVVRVLGYRSGGPGSIPGTTRKKVVGLKRGPPSLVSTTEELFDRKVAACLENREYGRRDSSH
jgi:hypothetical protein